MQAIQQHKAEFGIMLLIAAVLFYFIPLCYSLFKDGLGKGQSSGKKHWVYKLFKKTYSSLVPIKNPSCEMV